MLAKNHVKIRSARLEESNVLPALSIQVWLDTYAIHGISDVLARYVLEEFVPENFLFKLQKSTSSFLVAECNNNILGFIELVESRPCPAKPDLTLEIDKLYVMPRFQKYGIGTQLLVEAARVYREKGHGYFWLTTWHQNLSAIEFYKSKGFKSIGHINLKINDIDAPNIIFMKEL